MATMIRLNVRTGADDDCQLVGSGSDPPKPETGDVQLFRVAISRKILLTALLSVGTALVYGCRSPGSA